MLVTSRKTIVGGQRVYFRSYRPARRKRGRSPGPDSDPVVLLHGIAGSGDSWHGVLDELVDRGFQREVIVPDLLGHGRSSKPQSGYSLDDFGASVADLVRSRGHRRATLVGHSLGGAVAMRIAQTYPDLCGRLVLVSSGGLGGDLLPLIKATNLPGAELALSLVANPATLTVGSVLARLGGRWSVEDRELARCFSSLSDPRNRAAYVRIARNSIAADTQQAIVVPTLVLWGERDWIIPVKHGRKAGRRLLNSRLEVISGAEHFPHLSEPHLVAQHLIDFISRTRPVTPMTGIAAAG